MVEELIRGLRGWPEADRRRVALALVERLDLSDLGEVLACAHQRIHGEAERRASRKQGERVEGRRKK